MLQRNFQIFARMKIEPFFIKIKYGRVGVEHFIDLTPDLFPLL